VISAPRFAIEFLDGMAAERGTRFEIELNHPEAAWVGAGEPILYLTGPLYHLVDLETVLLQKLGPPCVAAYNASAMCADLPKVAFLAMDARHCAGAEMAAMMAYAAAVGSAVAQRARGFEMRVLGVRSREGNLHEVLREADVVSLHVPLTAATRGLLSRERLALLRDGATLVNTARGGVVDEEALVDELVAGRISAGLDVFVDEPRVPERLLGLPNVVLTPHIASATVETRASMTRIVVDNMLAAERGEPLKSPVP